jgi:hypothetical protein
MPVLGRLGRLGVYASQPLGACNREVVVAGCLSILSFQHEILPSANVRRFHRVL